MLLDSLFNRGTSKPPWFVSNFDSATGLVKALANCLHEKGFAGAGNLPENEWLAKVIDLLPWSVQRHLYVMGSAEGAVDPQKLGEIRGEDFSEWVVKLYPAHKYPAIFLGSSNGAAMHLAAAMGVPWLPQTFLVPVETPDLSPDQPRQRMEWARPWARHLLDSNPDLQLHHMMDPLQDRPMLAHSSYFRVKRLTMGAAYENFIINHLEKGGTLYLVECHKSWPATRVEDRHYFQFGGLGGLSPEEYYQGGDEVRKFLRNEEASLDQWDPPLPEGEQPESEWGFVNALREDVLRLAHKEGYQVQRISFTEPEALSPLVADLYRWWYRKRGIKDHRLLAEMFFLVEPYWALRMGAVPYWLAFNAQPSADRLKNYLRQTDPYDEMYLLPFSNGVSGPRLATESELKSILSLARKKGELVGAKPDKYPFDFGMYTRYEKDLKETIAARYPADATLTPEQLSAFVGQYSQDSAVTWIEG